MKYICDAKVKGLCDFKGCFHGEHHSYSHRLVDDTSCTDVGFCLTEEIEVSCIPDPDSIDK
jgi:hypothetical protein